jgi:cell division protein ZapA (FtsZ GTPase activity inhibitor)
MECPRTCKVSIGAEIYSLVTDHTTEEISQSSRLLDDIMRSIREKSPLLDEKRVVVLAALTVATQLVKTVDSLEQILSKS